MPKQRLIACLRLAQALEWLARNDQQMNGRDRRDVTERQTALIAIHLIAWNLSTQDAGKNRVTSYGHNPGQNSA